MCGDNSGCKKKEEPVYQGRLVSYWIQQLRNENKDACKAAADALIQIGKPSVPALIEALQDKAEEVRIEAVKALGKIKDKKAGVSLAKTLIEEELGSNLQPIILLSLKEIGPDSQTTDFLIERLRLGNERESAKAALALGAMGGERAILVLLQRLSLDRAYNKAIEDKAIEEKSKQAYSFVTSIFRELAIHGMKIREENAIDIINILRKKSKGEAVTGGYLGYGYEMVSETLACSLLKEIGLSAVNPVGEMLRDDNEHLRFIAVVVLRLIGGEKTEAETVIYPLLIFALKDEAIQVRRMAADALNELSKKDFGDDQEKWEKWWEENKDKFIKKK